MWNPAIVNWARDQMAQLFVWDHSEKQRIARAGFAQGYGLPDSIYARPFPGSTPSTASIVSQPAPAAPSGLSTLAKLSIGAALIGGPVGTYLAMKPAAPPTSSTITNTSGFDVTLEQARPK